MSDEERPYKLDLLVAVEIWAEDEEHAKKLANSTANWDDWDLIEVRSVEKA